jgi:hypothetical protein
VNLNRRCCTIVTTIIAISLYSAPTLLSLQDNILANAQNSTQSQTTKAKSTNASAPPIGNIQQLSKAVGNNSKILSSNVKIGNNPNFTQPKITSATPPNGLASNPTKGKSNSTSSSGTSGNTTNKGAAAGNMSKAGGAAAGNMSKAGGAAAGNMSKAGGAAAGNMSKAGGAAGNTSAKVLTNASKVVGSGLKGLGNAIGAGLKGLGNLISPGKK